MAPVAAAGGKIVPVPEAAHVEATASAAAGEVAEAVGGVVHV